MESGSATQLQRGDEEEQDGGEKSFGDAAAGVRMLSATQLRGAAEKRSKAGGRGAAGGWEGEAPAADAGKTRGRGEGEEEVIGAVGALTLRWMCCPNSDLNFSIYDPPNVYTGHLTPVAGALTFGEGLALTLP
jgi:hypothetical protein